MKKLKEEYQPGGSKRHVILDKAIQYLKDPKFGTQNAKHAFLLEEVGLSESEYLTCLNKQLTLGRPDTGNESTSRSTNGPGLPGPLAMARGSGTKLQAPSRKLQASSRKLDKGPVLCYSIL